MDRKEGIVGKESWMERRDSGEGMVNRKGGIVGRERWIRKRG